MEEYNVKSNRSAEPIAAVYSEHVDDRNNNQTAPPGTWEVGLFGCFTHLVPNCAMVTVLPCVSIAQTASKLEMMEKMSNRFRVPPYWLALVPTALVVVGQYVMLALFINQVAVIVTSDSVVWGYIKYKYHHWGKDSTWHIYLVLSGVCYALFAAAVWQLRSTARSAFRIRGGVVEDCWSSFWCPCCALAQTATQVKSYTPGSCSVGPPAAADTLPAYTRRLAPDRISPQTSENSAVEANGGASRW